LSCPSVCPTSFLPTAFIAPSEQQKNIPEIALTIGGAEFTAWHKKRVAKIWYFAGNYKLEVVSFSD
jgi:hypothetical protein